MSPVIAVENLGKKYTLQHRRQSSDQNLRESLAALGKNAWRRLSHPGQASPFEKEEEFWALKDISFEVNAGERIGIIGSNGAGKTTLLKILSRITEPTTGRARIKGRVASLLEVGTGFHRELTGRENIFLNGSILGMRHREIVRKFDEIVEFSGVSKFIDTPVKRYSSGMSVRLAFAVAAHLEPEILLVDEVLSVGDLRFQRKCLGKMEEVSLGGRTVLFVSHNIGAIRQLCLKSFLVEGGRLKMAGPTDEVIKEYLENINIATKNGQCTFTEDSTKEAQVLQVRLLNERAEFCQHFTCDEPIIVEFLLRVNKILPGLGADFIIQNISGTKVMASESFDANPNPLDQLSTGLHVVRITLPARTLAANDYTGHLRLKNIVGNYFVDSPGVVCSFRLDDSSSRWGRAGGRFGFFSTLLCWEVKKNS